MLGNVVSCVPWADIGEHQQPLPHGGPLNSFHSHIISDDQPFSGHFFMDTLLSPSQPRSCLLCLTALASYFNSPVTLSTVPINFCKFSPFYSSSRSEWNAPKANILASHYIHLFNICKEWKTREKETDRIIASYHKKPLILTIYKKKTQ